MSKKEETCPKHTNVESFVYSIGSYSYGREPPKKTVQNEERMSTEQQS